MASSDVSYEPKHSWSPARAFAFVYTQSMVSKLQTLVGQHKSWRAAMAHTSLSILGVLQERSLLAYTKYGIQATNTSGPAQVLARSDGSCMPKHSCSPARDFASSIYKVWK